MAEFSFNYLTEDDHAVISTDDRKWVNKIYKLAEERPDEVEIKHVFKDGFVTAHVPKSWIKVRPPVKRQLTEEQKKAYGERMRKARLLKQEDEDDEDEVDEVAEED